MEIISVNVSKRNSRLVWLKFSDNSLLPLSADDYVLMHLKKFTAIGDEQLLSIQTSSAKFLMLECSLRQVAISPKVKKILIQKLNLFIQKINLKYSYPASLAKGLIDPVVDKIESMGLLNTDSFIESFVRRHRQQSASQIKYQLRQLGISQPVVISNDVAKIKIILQKKYQPSDLSGYRSRQKIISKLYQKGFALNDIKTAIDDCL
jgi:SOS response regulatory protein OraA/RecX